MDVYAGRALLSNALGVVLALVSGLAQAHQLVDMGEGSASGINSSGDVALDTGIYSNGVLTPLPTSAGVTKIRAINDSGDVVGDLNTPLGACNAFLYSNGILTDLGTPYGDQGIDCASATAINSSGHVVGSSGVAISLSVVGFIYIDGVFTEIDTFPGNPLGVDTAAIGINDSDVVVGATMWDDGRFPGIYAFIYDDGSWTNLGPGIAVAINASGEVTGQSQALPDEEFGQLELAHAFIFSDGSMKDLGALNGHTTSTGSAINASGQVVGSSGTPSTSDFRAFFYNGIMSDLNSFVRSDDPLKPFVTLISARGINDDRLIVVNGIDSRTMETHAYLLQGPWTDIARGSLTFESEEIGSVSASQSVAVTNAGASSVSIDGIDVVGDFQQTTDCSTSLAPGATCDIMVSFAPISGGNREGTLTIVADTYPLVVQLAGVAPNGPGELEFVWNPLVTPSNRVQEGIGIVSAIFVRRLLGSEGEISVQYRTNSGTATAGSDFTNALGTLTWADGDTLGKLIEVAILDDDLDESTEQFEVEIFNPTGGATLSTAKQEVIVEDNDASPPPPPPPPPPAQNNGGGGATGLELLGLLGLLSVFAQRKRQLDFAPASKPKLGTAAPPRYFRMTGYFSTPRR